MWKPVSTDLALSDAHESLSHLAYKLWVQLLPFTDVKGRYRADSGLVKQQCLPLSSARLPSVDEALAELASANLIHLYDVGGKRYLVYHEPPKTGLKYQRTRFPDPPASLCPCLKSEASGGSSELMERRSDGVPNAASHSPPQSHSQEGGSGGKPSLADADQIFAWLKVNHVLGSDAQLRQHAQGWTAAFGVNRALEVLNAGGRGRDVLWINRTLFAKEKARPKPPPDCRICGGKGGYIGRKFSPSAGREIESWTICDHKETA